MLIRTIISQCRSHFVVICMHLMHSNETFLRGKQMTRLRNKMGHTLSCPLVLTNSNESRNRVVIITNLCLTINIIDNLFWCFGLIVCLCRFFIESCLILGLVLKQQLHLLVQFDKETPI